MSDAAISIRKVNKSFGSNHAVRDLDLDVPVGSVCGFLGPNGAGKSTTIRMIMSIIYPDSGSVNVLGGSALDGKDRIGYLPEERGVYRKMKVGEFLEYMGKLKGADRSNLREKIAARLKRIDLQGVSNKKCMELSKGMQQKVQFLAAIIHDPELVILDEPFSGLDPMNAELLNNMIDELRSQGKTIIFSTHVLHQAEQMCDRFFLINKGVKLLDATLEEIRTQFDPRTILVQPLNGSVDVSGVPGIQSIHTNGSATELEIDPNVDPHAVMQAILDRGPLRSIALRQLSMEEVFVQVVRTGAGEEAAQRAREELSHV